MRTRRSFKQQASFEDRMSDWITGIREQAATTEPGRDRDELLKKLRQAETAMHLQDWANSPGLQAPK